jgi:6-phosphogluconolactonase
MFYIGTYSEGNCKGIYRAQLNLENGALSAPELVAEANNASFLAIHPTYKYLYSVNEINTFKGEKSGSVTAYSIGSDGKLTLLNQQSSKGDGPCHISLDKSGRNALIANYGAGSVTVLPIQEDGHLTEASCNIKHTGSSANKSRQGEAHAHSIFPDLESKFAVVSDLGNDKVYSYKLDSENGILKEASTVSMKPGAGPRHFAFHPNGKFGYAINELDNTVTQMKYDASTGKLSVIESVSTLPADFKETSYTAEIRIHPNGKFLYGSNRLHDSIAIFSIDPSTGNLKLLHTESTRGKYPRNFNIDPSGKWLLVANQNGGGITVFELNPATGLLNFTGHRIELDHPVCVKFMP